MKRIEFEDFEDFVVDVISNFECEKCDDIAIISKYEGAKQIITELLFTGCNLQNIELYEPDINNYNSEYIVSLYKNKNTKSIEIWCEPMLRDNGYIKDESSIIYILDNCSSKVVSYCKGSIVFEVGVTFYFDSDEECEESDVMTDEEVTNLIGDYLDDNSCSEYCINGIPVDEITYRKALHDIEDRYYNAFKDSLVKYCEICDSINDLHNLLK